MADTGRREDINKLPKHVFLVFNKCLMFLTPLDKIERELFRTSELLYYKGILTLTIFNLDGYLNDYFYKKYGKCTNKVVDCLYSRPKSLLNYSYLNPLDDLSNLNHTLLYFINRISNKLVISTYDKDTHSKQRGLLLILIDRTHSHTKLLNSNNIRYNSKLNGTDGSFQYEGGGREPDWIREKTKKGVTLEYSVPNHVSICQPELQELVCSFNGVITSLPDLLISLRASLKDSLFFIANYLCRVFIHVYYKLSRRSTKQLCKPDFRLIYSSFLVRVGNFFRAGMTIIHSFGPEGVQPWFLAEAEIYESLGLSVTDIHNCVQLFTNTVRRWGK
ncbi:hypothetical protein MACK_001204 [Theileria orientalis]|uniref:Uncharacterized protein n=1 Tax=Theileria orientalis TaxID=68886 RepID=A0A976QUH9_THEOR|nr:hypothetical protein MACK_001204 [Theileria orientalis]